MLLKEEILDLLNKAKSASRVVAGVSAKDKNNALLAMANSILKETKYILSENNKDIILAKKNGLSQPLIDRLTLTDRRVKEMADSLRVVAELKDPVGEIIREWKRPNGLLIKKVRVPIGVVGIIYESRPNVTSDCIALCLKSGNVCVLRGGSEAIHSNLSIHRVMTKGIERFEIPKSAVQMVDVTDKSAVGILLKANDFIDVLIPRGGEGLIRYVSENTNIPVIKHYKGVCNLYIDKYADIKKALNITFNAKVQRPGVCNAIENLLVHKDVAGRFLPEVSRLLESNGVELRGCQKTCNILKHIKMANEKDWYEEYLDLILAVKVVRDVASAIKFINKYGTHHSDAIVTKNKKTAGEFLKGVDSACVYLNASTRFTDGHQFGFGAEIGISTDKLHARGPMALEELCTYKYIVFGNGQVR